MMAKRSSNAGAICSPSWVYRTNTTPTINGISRSTSLATTHECWMKVQHTGTYDVECFAQMHAGMFRCSALLTSHFTLDSIDVSRLVPLVGCLRFVCFIRVCLRIVMEADGSIQIFQKHFYGPKSEKKDQIWPFVTDAESDLKCSVRLIKEE